MKFRYLAAIIVFVIMAGTACAAPSVENKKKEIVFREAVNESFIASAREYVQKAPNDIRFKLHKISDADLVAFVQAFPDVTRLELSGGGTLVDLSPLASMAELEELRIDVRNIKDMSVLRSLGKLRILTIRNARDIAFLAGLPALTRLHIESCNDIADFAVIGQLANLTSLRLSRINTRSGDAVNLAFLARLPKLETLVLRSCTGVSLNVAGLNALKRVNMLKMNSIGGVQPLDLATLNGLPRLNSINLSGSFVVNFEALTNLPSIARVRIEGTKGITSLENLKQMQTLKLLFVSRNAFEHAQLTSFPEKVKIRQK